MFEKKTNFYTKVNCRSALPLWLQRNPLLKDADCRSALPLCLQRNPQLLGSNKAVELCGYPAKANLQFAFL
ncbi:hypothetical protein DDZ16_12990 [Marinilabilia rubra]|uniref:Uncharacterized protein n=1 Tax=Marinilabilia rubra TaxID=2162893 RepID=A0A2U2B761_9BACT|nr:hypothetical protein DDZ16_12990 [Marinilabilia rubra]